MSTTVTKYPAAYSASGTINGTRYKNCIGKPSSTTASGNDYAKGSGNTATITYTFDFSDIPSGATIESVEVKVGGHAENSTYNNVKKCELQLYSSDTAKGEMTHFTSTSKQVLTMIPGDWTWDELQNAQLRVTIGYYGGLVNGVDFTVTYSEGGGGDTTTRLRMKVNGTYKKVVRIFQKVDGHYIEVDESALDTSKSFVCAD